MEPLKEGETICPVCNGSGENNPGKRLGMTMACRKCQGHGKLDWVEMVVGVKSWRVKPGVYTSVVDESAMIPSFEQYTKELRESIKDMFKIPKELMISEDE